MQDYSPLAHVFSEAAVKRVMKPLQPLSSKIKIGWVPPEREIRTFLGE